MDRQDCRSEYGRGGGHQTGGREKDHSQKNPVPRKSASAASRRRLPPIDVAPGIGKRGPLTLLDAQVLMVLSRPGLHWYS